MLFTKHPKIVKKNFMIFDQHPPGNYFIVGNGKTMTIRDRGVFYETGASGENHRKPKRAIIESTEKKQRLREHKRRLGALTNIFLDHNSCYIVRT
jgi:hypothetical protein